MRDQLFVVIICFWTIVAILSNEFNIVLSHTEIQEITPDGTVVIKEGYSAIDKFFGDLDKVPIISYFVPLLKIMTYTYTDQVPLSVTLLLQLTAIFSAFIVFSWVRGLE